MPTRTRTSFACPSGTVLDGVIAEPDGAPRAWALYAHCFTCTKEIAAAVRISRELVERGVAVVRFDFAGLGASGGDFAHQTFSSNVADLVEAARQMGERHAAPDLLVGHSLGGTTVLAAAGQLSSVRAVATIAAPSEPAHVQKLFEDEVAKIRRDGEAAVMLAGRPFTITRNFIDDVSSYDLHARVKALGAALLVMHSPDDATVSLVEAARIYRVARHPKSFVSLPGADHLLTGRTDAAYAAGVIAAWSERYIQA